MDEELLAEVRARLGAVADGVEAARAALVAAQGVTWVSSAADAYRAVLEDVTAAVVRVAAGLVEVEEVAVAHVVAVGRAQATVVGGVCVP